MSGEKKPQLVMEWPKDRLEHPPPLKLPDGYSLRCYRETDKEDYIRLMEKAGFENWRKNFDQARKVCLPRGCFFIVHDKSGSLAATACATHNPTRIHPEGGELGWVAADPAHQGRSLGRIVCAAVIRRFLEMGYENIYLKTDDFRLPAIKTYLKQGWIPLTDLPGMKERWNRLRQILGK